MSTAKDPDLLLFGRRAATARIAHALDPIHVTPWWAPWNQDAPELLEEETIATVLVAPLDVPVAKAVAALRSSESGEEIPLFAVVPDGATEALIRKIYREGATAVIEWPRERSRFPDLMAELLALERVHGPKTGPDTALERTVRAHLRLMRGLGRPPRVRADAGVIEVSGQVDHLWQKQEIEQRVARVPGVRSVIMRNVHVTPSDQPDAKIKRNLRRILRDTADLDDETLDVEVQRGFVRLSGTVADRRELNRGLRVLAHVRGVRGIESLVRLSPQRQRRDQQVARRLRKILGYLHPGPTVSVAYLGGVAVLTGTVTRLTEKREIEELMADDDDVERVVNKIKVT